MRAFILVAVLVGLPVQAQGYDGNELVALMREFDRGLAGDPDSNAIESGQYMGYVTGVYEAYVTAKLVCGPANVTIGQVITVVGNYLKVNPSKWNAGVVPFAVELQRWRTP